MAAPTWLQRVADKLVVCFHGSTRIRIWQADGKAQGNILGGASQSQSERLLRLVLELKPEGAGTVDIVNDSRGHTSIRVHGSIADEGIEQRLRNTLLNM